MTQLTQEPQHIMIRYEKAVAFRSGHASSPKAKRDLQWILSNMKIRSEPAVLTPKQHPYELIQNGKKWFGNQMKVEIIQSTMKHFFRLQGLFEN